MTDNLKVENQHPGYEAQIHRGVEILDQCLYLQSEKDGVDRPSLDSEDRSKTLDKFAMDVTATSSLLQSWYKQMPMALEWAHIGRQLESAGLIALTAGESYQAAVLEYVKEHVATVITCNQAGTSNHKDTS